MATFGHSEIFKWCEMALSLQIKEIKYKLTVKPLSNLPLPPHKTIFLREKFDEDNNVLRLFLPDSGQITLNLIPGEPYLVTCQGVRDESVIGDVIKSLNNRQLKVVSCKMCHIECDAVMPVVHQHHLIPNELRHPNSPRKYNVKGCVIAFGIGQRARVFGNNCQEIEACLTYLKHRILVNMAVIEFPQLEAK